MIVDYATGLAVGSPSLRGSGLKFTGRNACGDCLQSPSLRGSGLKSSAVQAAERCRPVSLFTREWIEIFRLKGTIEPPLWSLPLYEGVD